MLFILSCSPLEPVQAQYDSIKEFVSDITVSSFDDCMLKIKENITAYTSVFGVTTFERVIPTTDFPTKYSWIKSVSASISAVPPVGFKVNGLKIYQTDVTSKASSQSILLSFSALDSLPKNTLIAINLQYQLLGPVGFFKNSSGFEHTILRMPHQFSIPVQSINVTYHHENTLSSTAILPFQQSNTQTLPQTSIQAPSNTSLFFSTSLASNELWLTGFVFDATSYHMCYIPYNLMEGWVVGAIIGSCLAIPAVFLVLCGTISIIRHFTVDRNKKNTLLAEHQV
ncbi:hypothetical protein FDP41_005026 [Naegleria fowleri]|uniref:Uncharacterized protein n=1 Tax=Naegleria fowleri TaxID=5763 RepID=A0A6A5BS12_NAEFO|nr:uncharacterized protein FDP41_005026 [Naegleria fowleri]KAF0975699.1 hypothetical protein FDP41_005026 [Naegleria fowleri]CAG4719184.1 unnamed protein product [Naegleria fowleri]